MLTLFWIHLSTLWWFWRVCVWHIFYPYVKYYTINNDLLRDNLVNQHAEYLMKNIISFILNRRPLYNVPFETRNPIYREIANVIYFDKIGIGRDWRDWFGGPAIFLYIIMVNVIIISVIIIIIIILLSQLLLLLSLSSSRYILSHDDFHHLF